MPDIWFDVDTAIAEAPANVLPLLDDTDFKTRETELWYNAPGLDVTWNFVTTGGAYAQTAVAVTTSGGNYDWGRQGDAMYSIGIPATGGASINNDTEGFGWFTGVATGVLPWRGPVIGFRNSALNDALVDGATIGVNVTAISGDTTAADNAELMFDGTGYAGGTTKLDVNAASIANGAITAAAIATGAIDADAIADNAIDAAAIANDAITADKIAAGAIDAATFASGALDAVWSTTTRTLSDGAITAATFAANALDAVWSTAARTLTSFGTLAADVWASVTRTLTSGAAPSAADIDAQLSATHGAGAWGAAASATIYGEGGSITFTYTLYDVDGITPLPGAAVWVSSDAAGTLRSQSKITDDLGQVQFELDAGTVYFWRSHPQRTFTNPDTEVVN